MIKTQELRLGNLVLGNTNAEGKVDRFEEKLTSILKVVTISADPYEKNRVSFDNQNACLFEENIFSIPLTDDWLIKLGFEKIDGREGYYWKHVKSYIAICHVSYFFIKHGDEISGSVKINSIHQLQNLYFALINEELIHN